MAKPVLLVVDDEPDIAEFVKEVGQSVGFEVKVATNAREFQEIITYENPSGIVMDIVMPDMDGIELINWLCANDCTAPILFMSGYDAVYLEAAKVLGSSKGCHIVGALSKPFTIDELEPMLQRIFNH